MKQRNIFRTTGTLTLASCLFSFTACNEFVAQSYKDGSALKEEVKYSAQFSPINSLGEMSGEVRIQVSEAELIAEVEFHGPGNETTHPLQLMGLDACPTVEEHDTNGDGFVDTEEARVAYGQALLAMDDQLSNPEAGDFPTSDRTGSFMYSQTVSLEELSAVLGKERPDLSGRVVVVSGVPDETELPNTVSAPQDGSAHGTLPVACAKLARSSDGPREDDNMDPQTQVQRHRQHQQQRRHVQQTTQQQQTNSHESPVYEMPELNETEPTPELNETEPVTEMNEGLPEFQ